MSKKINQAADHLSRKLLPEDERIINIPSKKEYHVAQYLERGERNRLSTTTLCAMLNCDRRTLQKKIAHDRKAGAWIISFSDEKGGYCLAESQEQYEDFCKWLMAKQFSSGAFFKRLISNYDIENQHNLLKGISDNG